MKRVNWGIKLSIATCMLIAPAAFAQYTSGFENFTASADGTILTGQADPPGNPYYVPPGTGTDFEV